MGTWQEIQFGGRFSDVAWEVECDCGNLWLSRNQSEMRVQAEFMFHLKQKADIN